MMPSLEFAIQLFRNSEPSEVERSRKSLLVALEALTQIDSIYLLYYPETPRLYESGIIYRPDDAGMEKWCDIPGTLARGWGDCKKLAAWRGAELRNDGEQANPFTRWRPGNGGWIFHALVEREDGTIEDPSLILGMGKFEAIPVPRCKCCRQKNFRENVYQEPASRLRWRSLMQSGLPHVVPIEGVLLPSEPACDKPAILPQVIPTVGRRR